MTSVLLSFLILLSCVYFGLSIVKTKTLPLAFEVKEFLGFKELLPTPPPYPMNKNYYPLPELSATNILVLDVETMSTLYEKNSNQRVSPASTTKVMTALVALESYPLDQILTVPDLKAEGNLIDLVPGEELTAESLLYGLLIGSGNDAAMALTENYPGGSSAFVEAMNFQANKLHLENTHYENSAGLDQDSHFSTARDLALLSLSAMRNETFARIVATSQKTIADVSGEHVHDLRNTNELVGKVEGVKGVKTGWTQGAGECLITYVERNDHPIVSVVLGSQNRFVETENLIDWIFTNFEWVSILPTSFR